ncbi:MAG: hypothetical protein AB7G11_00810 [Phycisphaerales bacterium]
MPPRDRPDMPPLSKAQERQRRVSLIAMYILGIGIGCVLVGLLLRVKGSFFTPPPSQPPQAPSTQTPPPSPARPN